MSLSQFVQFRIVEGREILSPSRSRCDTYIGAQFDKSVSSSHIERKERGDLLFAPKPTKNPKPNKDETPIVRGDPYFSNVPEWLQEFRENLVDDQVLTFGKEVPACIKSST